MRRGAARQRSAELLQEAAQQAQRIGPDCPRNRYEFDDVEPALAALELADEGLVRAEAFGELLLGHARLLARLHQQLAQELLLGRMNRLADAARRGTHRRGKLILKSDYHKRGCWCTIFCTSGQTWAVLTGGWRSPERWYWSIREPQPKVTIR